MRFRWPWGKRKKNTLPRRVSSETAQAMRAVADSTDALLDANARWSKVDASVRRIERIIRENHLGNRHHPPQQSTT